MSVTKTFTVTVVSTGGGNKYFIDGVQQPTLILGEGGTYKFDQSAESNEGHPLRFSTTSDGTHSGGSEYTTGVTINSDPGYDDGYTQIVVAEGAPTLYYYCTQHSGMGGQANTVDGNSWGLMSWGANEYGSQDAIDVAITGVSATSSVGSVDAFNIEGWGRQEWGNSAWGVDYSVELTGVQATSANGALTTFDTQTVIPTGQSSTSSVGSPTLDLTSVISLTGQQATSELGDFDNAGTLVGWGRNGWGEEPYGDSFNKLEQPAGVSTTSSVGALTLDLTSVVSPTGVSATSSVGSLSFVISSTQAITGLSTTASVGAVDPDQDIVGLSGLGMTSSVGSPTLEIVTELTGVSATTSLGDLVTGTVEIIDVTGVSATSSVGSLGLEIGVPLSGVSATSTVGAISPTSMTIGLTGQELTSSVDADGLILKFFGKLTPKTSTGYTTRTPKTSTGYTTKTPA